MVDRLRVASLTFVALLVASIGWASDERSSPSIAGVWLFRNAEMEVKAELGADGRFTRWMRTWEGTEIVRGRYEFDGNILTAWPEEEDEIVRLGCRLRDANTLELVDEEGNAMHLVRQGEAARPAPPQRAPASPKRPLSGQTDDKRETLVFQRKWEPKERAFTVLCPKGWQVEGGIFHVNPMQAGGAGNSIVSKCDLTLRRDDAGTVYVRWLPSYNYADMSRSPQAAARGMFPPGSNYNGMLVKPMPTAEAFLREVFGLLHPHASDARIVEEKKIPELAEIYRKINEPANAQVRRLGLPPMGFDAAGIVFDYTENGTRFREGLVTAIVDSRGGALMWSNDYTLAMRAPAAEADRWKPAMDIMRQSIRFNPEWVARAARAAGKRGETLRETLNSMQRIDQEIFEHRAKTHADARYESYLLLSGREEYVNPFTNQREIDTAEYEYRWTNREGDMIYTDTRDFDPNRVRELSHVTWKLTPVSRR